MTTLEVNEWSNRPNKKRNSRAIIPAAVIITALTTWCSESKNPEELAIEIEQTKIEMVRQIDMRRSDAIRYQKLKQDTDTLPSSDHTKNRKLIEELHLLEDIKIYNENIEKLDKKYHELKHENAENIPHWWDSLAPDYYDFLISYNQNTWNDLTPGELTA